MADGPAGPGCGCGVARGGPGGSDARLSPRRPRAGAPCAARAPVCPRRPDRAIPHGRRLQFSAELADGKRLFYQTAKLCEIKTSSGDRGFSHLPGRLTQKDARSWGCHLAHARDLWGHTRGDSLYALCPPSGGSSRGDGSGVEGPAAGRGGAAGAAPRAAGRAANSGGRGRERSPSLGGAHFTPGAAVSEGAGDRRAQPLRRGQFKHTKDRAKLTALFT